jgi:hypothetical protein
MSFWHSFRFMRRPPELEIDRPQPGSASLFRFYLGKPTKTPFAWNASSRHGKQLPGRTYAVEALQGAPCVRIVSGESSDKAPHFFCIFRLTSPETCDSLLLWSCSGHFVAVGRREAPRRKGMRKVPAMGECSKLQKMKNSGNEAKKYLKTKHITFLSAANCVRFACKLTQNRA